MIEKIAARKIFNVPFILFQSANQPSRVSCALTNMRYLEARDRHLHAVRRQLSNCKPNINAAGANTFLLQKYTEICSTKDWEKTEKHFVQVAREFKVVTYDTESFKKGRDSCSALESIIIGLYDGTCMDFNIVSLKKEAQQMGHEVVRDLRSFRWLTSSLTAASSNWAARSESTR